jgi:PilZ domain-containing protein
MSTSQKQHAIRRSTRLPLEIPVLVSSLNPAVTLSDQGTTTLVNAHGCGLIIQRPVPNGIQVRLDLVSAGRHTTGKIAEVVPLGGEPETWLLGIELDIPGNFWGIEYAPSDWKIEDADPATETPKSDSKSDSKSEPATKAEKSRRWRLTDISAGGCYLETPDPIQTGIPVLVSVRVANSECLLDGVVRASHPHTGMGVEFISPAKDHRARVENLIDLLVTHREVPRVMVGRKERAGRAGLKLDPTPTKASDPPDPLLDLIRRGDALSGEQFLDDLKAQRLGNRREPRTEKSLALLLTGKDAHGRPLDQRVTTVNISRHGALLQGIYGQLRQGDTITLSRGTSKEQFRVSWVGADGTSTEGQVGVTAVAGKTSLWESTLETNAPHPEVTNVRNENPKAQANRLG